jgi:uncharacterized caspase-like protein
MNNVWKRFLAMAVALLLVSTAEAYARRAALVIGNSSYQNAARLPNTANDSEQMARLLTAAGFEVQHYRDLALADFQRAVRDFAARTQDVDYAVVFFAGHGLEIGGTNYLIPVDARLASDFDVPDEAVSLDRVLAAIEPARQMRMVILDACRNNPFLPNMRRTSATRSVERGLGRIEPAASNTLVAFAAKSGSVAEDGAGPNSPYTAALLKHIALPGLDLRIAMGRVRDEVLAATGNRQEPYISGSLGGTTVTLADSVASDVSTSTPGAAPDPDGAARRDFELASRIGSADGLKTYISRYPTGFYTKLARAQLARLDDATSPAAVEPEKAREVIPTRIAGRTFSISATEVRDLTPDSLGSSRIVRRYITLQIDQAGGLKTRNRSTLPDGREILTVNNQGRVNQRGRRGGWFVKDGRLVGEFASEGLRWSGKIEPTATGCTAEISYQPPPGQKLIRLTNPNNGRSLQTRSVTIEGITCTARSN